MRISDWSSDVCSSDLHLGDARGLEAVLRAFHRRAQARTAGADHHGIIAVIDDLIGGGGHQAGAPVKAILRIEKMAIAAAAIVNRLSSTIQAMRPGPCS